MMIEDNNSRLFECCIIGAGPAGLGAALELSKAGIRDIVIIDKNKVVGGLARTDVFDGVKFDVGPHRFFTKNPEVNKIWHETLGSDFKPVSRLTRICYKNKFFNYPITPLDVLVKLGFQESLLAIFSFLRSKLERKKEAVTFEDSVIQNFGRKLYLTFFKSYTEKVWGIPCSEIRADWAAQRIKGLDALEVIKNALRVGSRKKIKTLIDEFDYPVLGAGQMYQAMADKIASLGGGLILDSRVVKFNRQDNLIKSVNVLSSDGKEINIKAKYFFSSVPLAHFFKMLDPVDLPQVNSAARMLRYRDHITVDLLIDKADVFPDQWIYVHSPDLQMARIANYNNFSKSMAADSKKTSLSVEYFVFKGSGLWEESDEFIADLAVSELEKIGLIKKSEARNRWVVREEEAYPIYDFIAQAPLELLKSRVSEFDNFSTIGRAGMHKYNNQDHSLLSGILAAKNYLHAPGYPFVLWDINIDAEYQEKNLRLA